MSTCAHVARRVSKAARAANACGRSRGPRRGTDAVVLGLRAAGADDLSSAAEIPQALHGRARRRADDPRRFSVRMTGVTHAASMAQPRGRRTHAPGKAAWVWRRRGRVSPSASVLSLPGSSPRRERPVAAAAPQGPSSCLGHPRRCRLRASAPTRRRWGRGWAGSRRPSVVATSRRARRGADLAMLAR